MNELQFFNNAEFGIIRSILINNEPWFVGRDIANASGIYYKTVAKQKGIDFIRKILLEELA